MHQLILVNLKESIMMKAILGFTSAIGLILVFTSTVSAFECPPIGSNETGYYSHETDCQKFYQCDNGIPVVHTCGEFEHFNPHPDVLTCDWEWNLDPPCVNQLKALATKVPVCPPASSDPEAETIYFPHEKDCTKYYMCSNGVAIERPCGPEQHWNPKINACDWPWNLNPKCVNQYEYKPRK